MNTADRFLRLVGRGRGPACDGYSVPARGVNLLGIDSVMQPMTTAYAPEASQKTCPWISLGAMIHPASLGDLPALGKDILKGQVKGRVVVDVNA